MSLESLFEQTWLRDINQCYITNIKALGLNSSHKKIFKYFQIKNVQAKGRGTFGPGVNNLNRFGRGSLLDATCQKSKDLELTSSEYKVFKDFFYETLISPRAGPFLAMES